VKDVSGHDESGAGTRRSPPQEAPSDGSVSARSEPEEPERSQCDPATIANLRSRVTTAEADLRRAIADAENLRKRMARDMARIRDQERANAARLWLPVVDNLDRALEHAAADPGSILDGVRAIRDQAVGVLADLGCPRREDIGERFDPARHEAVASVPAGDVPPGIIVQVVRPGYGSSQHQLRPAQVIVAKAD
jgi:molecular chaperone GrpE